MWVQSQTLRTWSSKTLGEKYFWHLVNILSWDWKFIKAKKKSSVFPRSRRGNLLQCPSALLVFQDQSKNVFSVIIVKVSFKALPDMRLSTLRQHSGDEQIFSCLGRWVVSLRELGPTWQNIRNQRLRNTFRRQTYKTWQELQMLSSVILYRQVTMIVTT